VVSHDEWQTVDRHLPELHGLMRSQIEIRYLASPPLVVAYAVAAD
jgi:hypothetical protein